MHVLSLHCKGIESALISTDTQNQLTWTRRQRNMSGMQAGHQRPLFLITQETYSGRVPATVSWANVFTFSLMTWIPRSSDALSSSTLCLYSTGLRHSGRTKVHQQNNKIRRSNMFVWPVNMFQGLGHQTRPHAAGKNRCLLLSRYNVYSCLSWILKYAPQSKVWDCVIFKTGYDLKIHSWLEKVGYWGKRLINVNVTYHQSPHIQKNSAMLINANEHQ